MPYHAIARGCITALLVVAAVASCGQQKTGTPSSASSSSKHALSASTSPTEQTGGASESAETDPHALLRAWSSYLVDYTAVASPLQLVPTADVVITGTVTSIVSGRIAGAQTMDDPFATRAAAMGVKVDSVFKGPVRTDETIWIELRKGAATLDGLRAVIPVGLPLAAYLVPAPESSSELPYGLEGAEFPLNTQIWSLVHPQGLIFGYDKTAGTVTPLTGDIKPADTIEDVVPQLR